MLTAQDLATYPLTYDSGHDDPDADRRYWDKPSDMKAGDKLSESQLEFVAKQLAVEGSKPVKFYVTEVGPSASSGTNVALEVRRGQELYVQLYQGGRLLPDTKLEWTPTKRIEKSLEEWYNRWKDDPYR